MFSHKWINDRVTGFSASRAWDGVWYIYDESGVYTGESADSRKEAVAVLAATREAIASVVSA